MSKSAQPRTRLQKAVDGCRVIFCRTNFGDVETVMPEEPKDDENTKREAGLNNNDDLEPDGEGGINDEENPQIDAGLRSPRWYERIDQRTEENRKRSIENKNLLQRVDYRTVWIARLLVATLAGILATVVVQALFL